MLSNVNDEPVEVILNASNFPLTDAQILRIDEENRYTLTGEALNGPPLTIPEKGCVEIQLFDLA